MRRNDNGAFLLVQLHGFSDGSRRDARQTASIVY